MKSNLKIIDKIKSIHGDKYSFDKFEYKSYKNKVTLVCNKHGDFKISLSNLISNKRGCPECGKLKYKNSCRSNTQKFVEKSKIIHNNKYDYKLTNYYNWKTKVSIICPIHGEFKQIPSNHLNGSGCSKCNKGRPRSKKIKLSKEDKLKNKRINFINESKIIHNSKYDYSLVEYISSDKKVEILCKKHGSFSQKPSHHKRGNGCPECAYENSFGPRIKTNDFITISKGKHNNFYSYKKSVYTGNKNKILITCPIHGDFKQNPKYHMNGGGCPKCNIGKNSKGKGNKKLKYKTDEFIKICRDVHSNKYDYTETKYKGIKNKIKVICPEHGLFLVRAENHMNGISCNKCARDEKKRNKVELISELNEIHNSKYEYHINDNYVSTKDKIKIICPEHGEFIQELEIHLRGSGCTLCKTKSRGEISIKNFLEKNKIKFIREKSFKNRLRFDFWLPDLNTIIEFDGKHHFEPIKYFGGEENFKKVKKNDNIKNLFCVENNINLLRISYKDYDNIEKIINKKIIENVKLQT